VRSLKRLTVSLAALILALGLAEIAFRVIEASAGRPYDAREVHDRIVALADIDQSAYAPKAVATAGGTNARTVHPFAGYAEDWQDDVLEAALKRRALGEDTFEVAIFGGSVAARVCQRAEEVFDDVLSEDPRFAGQEIHVLQLAVAGYKQPQQVMLLAYLLALGLRPDVAINLDGYNELVMTAQNMAAHAHPALPSLPQWLHASGGGHPSREALDHLVTARTAQTRLARWADSLLDSGLYRSALAGGLGLRRIEELNRTAVHEQQRYAELLGQSSQEHLRGPQVLAQTPLEYAIDLWVDGSLSMKALCTEHSIRYVHVLQPTLMEGSKTPTAREQQFIDGTNPRTVTSVREGYPRLKEASATLVARGVEYVDATGVYAGRTDALYTDVCHPGKEGCAVLARTIARALLAPRTE